MEVLILDLKIDVEEKEEAVILKLDGEVDVYTAPKLKRDRKSVV